jgi:CHAD domain-containing protein
MNMGKKAFYTATLCSSFPRDGFPVECGYKLIWKGEKEGAISDIGGKEVCNFSLDEDFQLSLHPVQGGSELTKAFILSPFFKGFLCNSIGTFLLEQTKTLRYFGKTYLQDKEASQALHDFRIALRKTRSVLDLLLEEVPLVKPWQKTLKGLSALTSKLRDFDVLLQDLKQFVAEEEDLERIKPFLRWIDGRRSRAYKKFCKKLKKKQLFSLLGELEKEVREHSKAWPLTPIASSVQGQLDRFLCIGLKACAKPTDTNMHRIRIEQKKLRYVSELLEKQSLWFPRLCDFQETLGRRNDLVFRRNLVQKYLKREKTKKKEFLVLERIIRYDALEIESLTEKYRKQFMEMNAECLETIKMQ